MKEPMFIRKTNSGKPVQFECLMTPTEVLLNKRILHLNGTIAFTLEREDGQRGTVDIISEALLCLDTVSNDPIKLIISSPGGSVVGAFSLYDIIRAIDSPVWTFGRICHSGAALILAAGDRGHRYVYHNTFTMLHLPHLSERGGGGTDTDTNLIRAKQYMRERDRMVELFIECGIKKTKEQLLEDIDREFWLDAKEVVEYGLADEVIRGGLLLDGD